MAQDLFSVPIFFIIFRETLEASVIVSVLLSFLHQLFPDDQVMLRRTKRHIWLGTGIGLLISLSVGAAFVAVWYTVATNLWTSTEDIWEGSFMLVAVLLITPMSLAMLKTEQLKEKWSRKLAASMGEATGRRLKMDVESNKDVGSEGSSLEAMEAGDFGPRAHADATEPVAKSHYAHRHKHGHRHYQGVIHRIKHFFTKHGLLILPLVTVLREGIEAMVFVAGVSITEAPTSIPIAAIAGIACGVVIGFLIYRGGNLMNLHYFFVASTCLLLMIAAGLFSKAVGFFQKHWWTAKTGGEGTYDLVGNVWHTSWGDPENVNNNGWLIFNAIFGWTNNATVGTVVSYCLYWVAIVVFLIWNKASGRKARKEARKIRKLEAKKREIDEANRLKALEVSQVDAEAVVVDKA